MKRRILALALVVASLVCFAFPTSALAAEAGRVVEVVILTDVHGNLVNSSGNPVAEVLGKEIENIREKAKADNGETLIIGGGDLYQGTALSNMLNGTPMVEFFNLIQLDVASLGNHEFDWSLDTLNNVTLTDAAYSTLCANLRYGANYPADKLPEGKSIGDRVYDTYKIFDKSGVKIAVIGGILTEAGAVISAPAWAGMEFTDLSDEVLSVAEEIALKKEAGEVDVVIGSFHAGIDECKAVINTVNTMYEGLFDIVAAGHTHKNETAVELGVPIYNAQNNGRGYYNFRIETNAKGEVVIPELSEDFWTNLHRDYNGETGAVGYRGEVPDEARSEAVAEIVAMAQEEVAPIAGIVIGTNAADIEHKSAASNNWATNALRVIAQNELKAGNLSSYFNNELDVKVAFANDGGLRTGFEVGDITVGHMYNYMPFDNEIYLLEADIEDLTYIIEQSLGGLPRPDSDEPVEVIGTLPFAGVICEYDSTAAPGERVMSLIWEDGSAIDPSERFYIAVPDFVATGGDNYFSFIDLGLLKYVDDDSSKDCLNNSMIKNRDAFIEYIGTDNKEMSEQTETDSRLIDIAPAEQKIAAAA